MSMLFVYCKMYNFDYLHKSEYSVVNCVNKYLYVFSVKTYIKIF